MHNSQVKLESYSAAEVEAICGSVFQPSIDAGLLTAEHVHTVLAVHSDLKAAIARRELGPGGIQLLRRTCCRTEVSSLTHQPTQA
jgi:hypothetical protein